MNETVSTGKIVLAEGKYFLELAGSRQELPSELLAAQPELKDLTGKEVGVLFSEPQRSVVGLQAARRPPILCYIPAPEFHVMHEEAAIFKPMRPICYVPADWVVKGVEQKIRENLAKELLNEGVIGKEVYDRLLTH